MKSTTLNAHIIHLVLTMRQYHYHFHFTEEKIETVSNLHKNHKAIKEHDSCMLLTSTFYCLDSSGKKRAKLSRFDVERLVVMRTMRDNHKMREQ